MYRRVARALCLFFVCLPLFPLLAADSSGTDFWIAFPTNAPPNDDLILSLVITAATSTTGTITNPALAINLPFNVTAGTATTITIPNTALVNTLDTIESKGLHVTANDPVTLAVFNRRPFTSDGYLALPVDAIGTAYRVGSWRTGLSFGTSMVVLGTENGTTVTIELTANAGARTAGVPFDITLDAGETFFLHNADSTQDLTGSSVVADRPVAVFGGHSCAEVPTDGWSSCDYVVEQMMPIASQGTSFYLLPFVRDDFYDVFRIVASTDGTEVFIDGGLVATLQAGEVHDDIIFEPRVIATSQPVSVYQFASGDGDDVENLYPADPLMMTILPTRAWQASYIFSTETVGWSTSRVMIVAPAGAVGSVMLDGAPVDPAQFTPIGTTGFSGAQIPVVHGAHSVTAGAPVGVHVYGLASAEGYGYPAGALAAQLAADLQISKSVSSPVSAGSPVAYTIVVTNAGSDAVTGARVTDDFPPELGAVDWTCVPSAGAVCTPAGSGDIDDFVTLPPGGTVTYTTSSIAPLVPAIIVNSADVAPPDNTSDPVIDNNAATAELEVEALVDVAGVPTLSPLAMAALAAMIAIAASFALRS